MLISDMSLSSFRICHLQVGDLKGLFGLLMVNIQKLREKAKVLDLSYGHGTGKFVESVSAEMQDNTLKF